MPSTDITIVPSQTSLDFLRGLARPSSKVTAQDIDDWRCSLALDWLEARERDVTTLVHYLSAAPAIPVLAIWNSAWREHPTLFATAEQRLTLLAFYLDALRDEPTMTLAYFVANVTEDLVHQDEACVTESAAPTPATSTPQPVADKPKRGRKRAAAAIPDAPAWKATTLESILDLEGSPHGDNPHVFALTDHLTTLGDLASWFAAGKTLEDIAGYDSAICDFVATQIDTMRNADADLALGITGEALGFVSDAPAVTVPAAPKTKGSKSTKAKSEAPCPPADTREESAEVSDCPPADTPEESDAAALPAGKLRKPFRPGTRVKYQAGKSIVVAIVLVIGPRVGPAGPHFKTSRILGLQKRAAEFVSICARYAVRCVVADDAMVSRSSQPALCVTIFKR